MTRVRHPRILAAILVPVAVWAGVTWILADRYLYPARQTPTPAPPFVETTMLETPTWVTPGWEGRRVVFLCAHGYGGTRSTWREIGADLARRGYGVVAPAMPGQERSPVSGVGFGEPEAELLVRMTAEVSRCAPKAKVVLLGLSLGGSACWLAAEQARPDAVATEAAFARLNEAVEGYIGQNGPVPAALLRPVVWLAQRRAGLDPRRVRPLEAAARWRDPALLISGDEDTVVPPSVERRFAKVLPQAARLQVAGARHSRCYEVDPAGYVDALDQLARGL